jgi:drug/metabolite transporter (DMT)-like permease
MTIRLIHAWLPPIHALPTNEFEVSFSAFSLLHLHTEAQSVEIGIQQHKAHTDTHSCALRDTKALGPPLSSTLDTSAVSVLDSPSRINNSLQDTSHCTATMKLTGLLVSTSMSAAFFFKALLSASLVSPSVSFYPSFRHSHSLHQPISTKLTPLFLVSRTPETVADKAVNVNTDLTAEDLSNPFVVQDPVVDKPNDEYTRGILIIGFITLLNASCNPLWHAAFSNGSGPPPLLLNAGVSIVAWLGLIAGGPLLDKKTPTMSQLAVSSSEDTNTFSWQNLRGGMELGFWKFLGTSAHLVGLSLTTANHGAFLIQLTTLIVPVLEALQGEKIPRQIQIAIGLALAGVYAFTQDPNSSAAASGIAASQMTTGDLLCIAAAVFYSLYDIQTFKWGKVVPRTELVTTKIGTQAVLSIGLCAALAGQDTLSYFTSQSTNELLTGSLIPVVLWSGLIVNALATFLQVGGMQAVGPTRAQTIFASQPLWSSLLAFWLLGETVGFQGAVGGGAFLLALFLAATAPKEIPTTVEATTTEN